MTKLWSGHEKIDPIFRPLTSKCDLDLGAMDLGLVCDTSFYDG